MERVMTPPPGASVSPVAPRNPGPCWGYPFLRITDRIVPEVIFRPFRAVGTAIALLAMKSQRRSSREYLRLVLGREPGWKELFHHFFAFEEGLMLRLRVANGRKYPCHFEGTGEPFGVWYRSGGPVLLGTFHVGVSDTLGFQLAGDVGRVYLVRQRVGNSHDTERLAARFGDGVRFIWVNQPSEMLFALKEAATAADGAIALQCDRMEFAAKTEIFEFLGARRRFPFTIYHLACIFQHPVILTVGLPAGDHSRLYSSDRFEVRPGERRQESLARGREHFQAFLTQLEGLLRKEPYQWFNFLPLNPPVDPSS